MKNASSKLVPFEAEIRQMRASGVSLRRVADQLKREHGLDVTYNAVFSFLKTREAAAPRPTPFFRDLPTDIREALIKQLQNS